MVTPPVTRRFTLPLWLLLLDFLGLAMVGLGIAQQVGRLQWFVDIPYGGLLMMGVGIACMLPLVGYMVKVVKQARQEENAWFDSLPADIQKKISR